MNIGEGRRTVQEAKDMRGALLPLEIEAWETSTSMPSLFNLQNIFRTDFAIKSHHGVDHRLVVHCLDHFFEPNHEC
jgi:hypothetical protein